MTSVVGITALQELRKFKGFEAAIIAGGFVRDSVLGGSIKDLDIFIPCDGLDGFKRIIEQHFLVEEIKDAPKEDVQIRIAEANFDAWLFDQEEKGIDPWKRYLFDFNHGERVYIASLRDPRNLVQKKVTPNIGNFKGLAWNSIGYRKVSPSYLGHYDCKYMDFLDVDIIGYQSKQGMMKDFEGNVVNNFGNELVAEFNYNIDKVYFDGEATIETSEFKRDRKNNEATLVKLSNLESLPHAMRKFERLREKYPKIVFRSTILDIKREEEDNSHKKEAYKSKYYTTSTNTTTTFVNLDPNSRADRPWR